MAGVTAAKPASATAAAMVSLINPSNEQIQNTMHRGLSGDGNGEELSTERQLELLLELFQIREGATIQGAR
ncbi:hypothetical protein S58_24610 [Bradyrhizobium oligotrophicum S58]|uniref:Uncharacterized protein n=1 Tax=Bradyrhizobium oligotrophicum S58 TaxID=1245469 RepID=M4Z5T1_9BRAD|nr:hypothetical protein S58_24610 [Bradyrhizobium oligotrophicum S58]